MKETKKSLDEIFDKRLKDHVMHMITRASKLGFEAGRDNQYLDYQLLGYQQDTLISSIKRLIDERALELEEGK